MSKTQLTVGLSLLSVLGWAGLARAIPEPAAWYNAGDLSLDNGVNVDSWPDKTVNGLDLTTRNQGADITITYNASAPALNNLPAVHWPGGSPSAAGAQNHTYMHHAASSALASTELTIFAVGTWTALTNAAVVSVYDTTHGCPEWSQFDLDSSMEDGAMIGYSGQNAWHHNFMSNYAGVNGSGNTTSIIEGLFGTAPEDTRVYVDGVFGSYPPGTSSNDTWGTQHLLGDLDETPPSDRGVKLGHADFWHAAWNYPTMDLAEVIIYNRKLSDAERNQVGVYLQDKYNIAGAYFAMESVLITETEGFTEVSEQGPTSDTYTIVLQTVAPTGNVVITADPDDQLQVNGLGPGANAQLTFTTINWQTAQTVTVTAYEDAVSEGPHSATIIHTAAGGGYDGVSIADVVVDITDNEHYCGEPNQVYLNFDVTGPGGEPDCYVNLYDFIVLASQWLKCTDLSDPSCSWPEEEPMVYIPAGTYTKGISTTQANQLASQYGVDASLFLGVEVNPQEQVHVDAFYIDRNEVTNEQYAEYMAATGAPAPYGWVGGQYPAGQGDYPVAGPSWAEAQAYATWAGKRLPTEDEWEKASRGTDGRLYPWGDTWQAGMCRMDTTTQTGDDFGLAPVGSYAGDTSPYGVRDMAGNVSEWTATIADNTSYADFPIIKGGNYLFSQPYNFRCSLRQAQPPSNGPVGFIGFRCAMDAEPDLPQTPLSPPVDKEFISETLPETRYDLYGTDKIQLINNGGRMEMSVGYLPNDTFVLNMLESFPGGSAWRSANNFVFSQNNTVATLDYTEPGDTPQGGRLQIHIEMHGEYDHVNVEYWFKNISSINRTLDISSCFNATWAPNFRDHEGIRTFISTTAQGFKYENELSRSVLGRDYSRIHSWIGSWPAHHSFFCIVSRDGQWVISQASADDDWMFNNLEYSCQHVIPFYTLVPNEERTIVQKMYFLYGTPADVLTRWQTDF